MKKMCLNGASVFNTILFMNACRARLRVVIVLSKHDYVQRRTYIFGEKLARTRTITFIQLIRFFPTKFYGNREGHMSANSDSTIIYEGQLI